MLCRWRLVTSVVFSMDWYDWPNADADHCGRGSRSIGKGKGSIVDGGKDRKGRRIGSGFGDIAD